MANNECLCVQQCCLDAQLNLNVKTVATVVSLRSAWSQEWVRNWTGVHSLWMPGKPSSKMVFSQGSF